MTLRVQTSPAVRNDVRAVDPLSARADPSAAAPTRAFTLALNQEELVPETQRRSAEIGEDVDSLVRAGFLRI